MKFVRVTQDDIERGLKQNVDSCPLALALKRKHPGQYVKVARRLIFVGSEIYCHSPGSDKFIKKFDTGRKVRPTFFLLPLL